MKRRSRWHDYSRKGTYMLTLVVQNRQPLLGSLQESNGKALIEPTPLGVAIRDTELAKITHYYPMVKVWKACLMPDHLHIIVHITQDMADNTHLGRVITGFKTGCNHAYWQLNHMQTLPRPGLFEPSYNDKILLDEGQLDHWKDYLDDNPRRLLIKRQNPQLFTILDNMQIAGRTCAIVGNRFLLNIPDKVAVIVHRRYSDSELAQLRNEWLACGERGGVIVSAAISPKEQAILHEAMERGYNIIYLRENGFPPLYKPAGKSFYACSNGTLLMISPNPYHTEKRTITRAQCLDLNGMAEAIARLPNT